jgi:hypothetical protein
MFFSQYDLQKKIPQLQKAHIRERPMTNHQILIKELQNYKPLKHIVAFKPISFQTQEVDIFKTHFFNITKKLNEKCGLVQSIKEKLINDEKYSNHLRSIRDFKFKTTTFLDQDCVLPKEEFMYDIESSNFVLNKIYEEDFYVIRG